MLSATICTLTDNSTLEITDFFRLFLWIALALLNTTYSFAYLTEIDMIVLKPILSLFVLLFTIVIILVRRSKRRQFTVSKYRSLQKTNGISQPLVKNIRSGGKKSKTPVNEDIGTKIKSLRIGDDLFAASATVNRNSIQSFCNSNGHTGALRQAVKKNVIMPAKFKYNSNITRTSWAAPRMMWHVDLCRRD